MYRESAREVVDEQRMFARDRRTDQAGAELQPHRLARIRIADRICRAQFAAALVEQIDGERFERDQPADQARDLVQQIIEIENTGDLPSEVEQRREELVLRVAAVRRCWFCPVRWNALTHFDACPPWLESRLYFPVIDRPPVDLPPEGGSYSALLLRTFQMDISLPLDYSAIERILPHRYPFLLVDRITEFEPDKRIVGIKNVTLNERYLAHRPGELPVLPPTILTEAVAQVGAIMILAKPENREKLIYFCRHRARAVSTRRASGRRRRDRGARAAASKPHGPAARRRARRRPGRRRRHDDVRARPAKRRSASARSRLPPPRATPPR